MSLIKDYFFLKKWEFLGWVQVPSRFSTGDFVIKDVTDENRLKGELKPNGLLYVDMGSRSRELYHDLNWTIISILDIFLLKAVIIFCTGKYKTSTESVEKEVIRQQTTETNSVFREITRRWHLFCIFFLSDLI